MPINESRIRSALQAAMEAGVPFRRAAIVIAVSARETGTTFGMPRAADLPYPISCHPARQVLTLERGRSTDLPFPSAVKSDAELMAWFTRHGLLASAGNHFVSEMSKIDTLENPNNSLALVFEFIIDQRKGDALSLFSIGPTMMYLKYSPLAKPQYPRPERFATWEELFRFYRSTSVAEVFNGEWFRYLPTDRYDYPTDQTGRSTAQSYLENVQTGMVDWSDPDWNGYASSFMNAVVVTWRIAREIGYPSIK